MYLLHLMYYKKIVAEIESRSIHTTNNCTHVSIHNRFPRERDRTKTKHSDRVPTATLLKWKRDNNILLVHFINRIAGSRAIWILLMKLRVILSHYDTNFRPIVTYGYKFIKLKHFWISITLDELVKITRK